MIKAVIFDLDDTLFPEIDYVKSGFATIADCYEDKTLSDRFYSLFCEDRKNVYQRAGLSEEDTKKCVEIYGTHMPQITLDEETDRLLDDLKKKDIKTGIITDGRPEGQWNKINALGLKDKMDFIIVTDELGGEKFRKPNVTAFEIMREKLGVEFDEMMYVGDNPVKDFYIGKIYPVHTVRLTKYRGFYGDCDYYENHKENKTISAISDILEEL